jgi:HemX protein
MFMGRFLYDAFVTVYAVSMVLFFIDAVQPRRVMNRTALVLLFFVFLLETLFLVNKLRLSGSAPIYTPFDALLLLSWLILLAALVFNAFFRIDLLLFLANVLGFGIVAFDAFGLQASDLYSSKQGDLLVLHITFALCSYAAFSFAFMFSFMYLIQDKFLREKRWTPWYFRLPALDKLDKYTYRSILMGFPFLLIAMVLGAVWGKLTLGHFLLMDPKPLATTMLWVMYGIYLLLRLRSGWGGAKLVWYNVICFSGVIANFLVIGSFSLFHHTM